MSLAAEQAASRSDRSTARWAAPSFASLGGFCVALSLPPWGWWPLAFVGATILAVAIDRADAPSRAAGRRALTGAAFALPWMTMGMGWMWFLTVPGYLVAAAIFTSLHALAAAASPGGRWAAIGRPAAHTLVEALRLVAPFGGVPLATLGISQSGGWFLPIARVGGVVLLTWFVFQAGAVVAAGLAAMSDRARFGAAERDRPLGMAAAAVVLVAVVAATVAPAGDDTGEVVVVTAVQGGGEQGTSALDVPSRIVTERLLTATATIAPDPERDVVVWPENGVDVNREPFDGSAAATAIAAEAERLGVPFLVGVTLDGPFSETPSPEGFANIHAVLEPDGTVGDVYQKVRIVPFGEYVPLRGLLTALGAPLERVAKDALRGEGPSYLTLPDGTRFGVVISWEVFFGDRGRAAADADIVINPTNGASYTGTVLQTQQVASSRLRAAETGRWVVQVSPTGFTAFVSPHGEVLQRTDVSEQAVIELAVPVRAGTTWYRRTGDLPWVVLAGLAFAAAHLATRTSTRTAARTAARGAGRGAARAAQHR